MSVIAVGYDLQRLRRLKASLIQVCNDDDDDDDIDHSRPVELMYVHHKQFSSFFMPTELYILSRIHVVYLIQCLEWYSVSTSKRISICYILKR